MDVKRHLQTRCRSVVLGLLLALGGPLTAGAQSVEILVANTGERIDPPTLSTLRQIVGHHVASGVVNVLITHHDNRNKIYSICLERSQRVRPKRFESLIRQLQTIKFKRASTTYRLSKVIACERELVPCTADVKICADGETYVSRLQPRCEFAPCPPE